MSKPIRVLHVVTIMNLGGIEAFIMNFYRNIDRSKIQFDFIVHRKIRGHFDDEIEKLGGVIYRFNSISLNNIITYNIKLNKFFKNHTEYSIIHSHISSNSFFVLNTAKRFKIKCRIAHSHSNAAIGPKRILKILLKILLIRQPTHFFACSEDAAKWLFSEKQLPKVKLFKNAIVTDNFKFDKKRRDDLRSLYNINSKTVYGHIGNFNLEKNHFFLLEIFSEIMKIDSNSKLLLIGDGKLREEIYSKIIKLKLDDCVELMGSREDISDILQMVDIFIFPSFFEGFGIVAIEAQASGLKTFVSDSLPKEIFITNNIFKISLNKTAKQWANIIYNNQNKLEREDQYKIVANEGYDIKSNVIKLQKFYLRNS
ncbi:glycosyltransferase family 1 protein [uncultured Lutibacter sp.]|uniref:glycosyltransferase family 1 protein n=1 Tax=uncultured Lutibacter sp. TaxID=437739 RepID=UPI0026283FCE|nr:glycosyltransferase family 1 protein [uncultured Lutibacter sp.]